ncbi:DUF4199 domain-containing protein [Ekhidna sp.]|uniref:DUF4199 domain-containing protein n=1 Tax=Ekhidna sp. TaxID=2608089 RepID=UPI003B4FFD16
METLEKHILRYGIYTTLGLIAFFFIMKLFGLIYITELRAFNALIMFAGTFAAIKKFKNNKSNLEYNYLSGIGTGFAVGLMTAAIFSAFILVYLFIDGAFMQSIIESQNQKLFLNQFTIAGVIFVEAMASGFLFSYISMQWLKSDEIVPLTKASKA